MRLRLAANGTANAKMASHFRRPHTPCTNSTAEGPRASSAIGISPRVPGLGHQDDVARLEVDVFLLTPRRDDLVVVERNARHGLPVRPQDDDPRAGGELGETPGLGQDVENCRPALQL